MWASKVLGWASKAQGWASYALAGSPDGSIESLSAPGEPHDIRIASMASGWAPIPRRWHSTAQRRARRRLHDSRMSLLEPLRLNFEPWRLTLEPWSLRLEPWMLIRELLRLTLVQEDSPCSYGDLNLSLICKNSHRYICETVGITIKYLFK